MSIADYERFSGVIIRKSIIGAGLYLESIGQRFLVDFGYANAVEKATAEFIRRAERQFKERP
jgi:hypothetical protein